MMNTPAVHETANRKAEAPKEILQDSAEAVHHSDVLATNIIYLQKHELERLDEVRRKEVERIGTKARFD